MSRTAAAGPSRRATIHAELNQPDADLLTLAARLSLEDIEYIERHQRRNARDGVRSSDAEMAFELFALEARNSIVFNNDRAIARAMQEAERQTPLHVPPVTRGGVPVIRRVPPVFRPPTPPPPRQPDPQPSFMSQMLGIGSWLMSFVSSSAEPRLTGRICVICQDPIRGAMIRAPCGHHYDQGCITDLFRSSTTDESLFPPRCCRRNISLQSARLLLPAEIVNQFNEKEREFSTLKRVYCANPRCSRFLGPLTEGWAKTPLTCPAPDCGTRTCSACRRNLSESTSLYFFSYYNHTCQPDDADASVIELGRVAQWARCPSCEQMIELAHGCFHMTCRCKTEFCYLCRARWKTCRCPQWDENRLVNAAEARVDAQIAGARVGELGARVVPDVQPPPRRLPPLPPPLLTPPPPPELPRPRPPRSLPPTSPPLPQAPPLPRRRTLVRPLRGTDMEWRQRSSLPSNQGVEYPLESGVNVNSENGLSRSETATLFNPTRSARSTVTSSASAGPSTSWRRNTETKKMARESFSNESKDKTPDNKNKGKTNPGDLLRRSVSWRVPSSGSSSSSLPPAPSSTPIPAVNQKRIQSFTTVLETINERRNELASSGSTSSPSARSDARSALKKTMPDRPGEGTVRGASDNPSRSRIDGASRNQIIIDAGTSGQRQKRPEASTSSGATPRPHSSIIVGELPSTNSTTGRERSKPERRLSLNLSGETAGGKSASGSGTSGESEKAQGKRPAHKSPASPPLPSPSTTAASRGVRHGRWRDWDENLSTLAEEGDAQATEIRARLVREHIARLREHNNCVHPHWRTERGGGRCEMCHHDLRLYIFVCTACQASACNRCRRNRL